MTQVTLSGLTKIFDQKSPPAVDNLDLEIESGKLTALLGPSGCGKTTTMKMIAGLLRPTAGDILFDGDSILSIKPEERGAVMVFQNYLLFPYMNIADNIGFGLKMRKVNKKEIRSRVEDMLDLVQLPGFEDRKPNQLSGGQQQRIALARALIVQPNVLLLDEPLSNLDAHLRDEMRVLIRRIQTEMGITTVFVTHDQEEAVVLADKVALLFDGRLQQFDAPDSFYDTPNTVDIATFFGGTNFIPGYYLDGTITTDIGVSSAQLAGSRRRRGAEHPPRSGRPGRRRREQRLRHRPVPRLRGTLRALPDQDRRHRDRGGHRTRTGQVVRRRRQYPGEVRSRQDLGPGTEHRRTTRRHHRLGTPWPAPVLPVGPSPRPATTPAGV